MSESEGEGNSETEFEIQPYQFEPQLSDDEGERSSDGASSESDGSEVEDHADSIRLGNTEWQVKIWSDTVLTTLSRSFMFLIVVVYTEGAPVTSANGCQRKQKACVVMRSLRS